jgi:hypothetical protein
VYQVGLMKKQAAIREEFVKLLFAVAITIGVAISFDRMEWVKSGILPPKNNEWEQLAVLLVGLVATVASWDGYLAAIANKPLNGALRYSIDIILVFVYMFFLISAEKFIYWPWILVVIFFLYVVWDLLTIREYLKSYDSTLGPRRASQSYRASFKDIMQVYWRGFLDRPQTSRGPVITLSWLIYFVGLSTIDFLARAQYQLYLTVAFAIVGLLFYRFDKSWNPSGAQFGGYQMCRRALTIFTFVTLAGALFYYFRTN